MKNQPPKFSDAILRKKFFSLSNSKNLAQLLQVEYRNLNFYLYRLPIQDKYSQFSIPKRNPRNGERIITAPCKGIKTIQKSLNYILNIAYPFRSCVTGFISKRSIRDNAYFHSDKKWVLNLDLKDFFPSINFGRVRGFFFTHLPGEVATVLAQICCYQNTLPQGAPTSPTIANLICSRLDTQLQRLGKKHKCKYSRYADDITFSTNKNELNPAIASVLKNNEGNTLVKIGDELKETIINNGFTINENKIKIFQYSNRQTVTGLVVNRFPNTTKKFQAQIKAMIHAWKKFGLEKAELACIENKYCCKYRNPLKSPLKFEQVLRGKLAYYGSIRGGDDNRYLAFVHDFNLLPDISKPIKPVKNKRLRNSPTYALRAIIKDKAWRIREETIRINKHYNNVYHENLFEQTPTFQANIELLPSIEVDSFEQLRNLTFPLHLLFLEGPGRNPVNNRINQLFAWGETTPSTPPFDILVHIIWLRNHVFGHDPYHGDQNEVEKRLEKIRILARTYAGKEDLRLTAEQFLVMQDKLYDKLLLFLGKASEHLRINRSI